MGGKHRMARISSSLRALDIDIRLIADIDILNDETIFKNIVEAYDINWSDLQRDYNILASNLHSSKEKINRNEAKTIINNILDSSYKSELTSIEIRKVCSAVKVTSKWEALKDCGISAIPSGDATNSYINLTQSLQKRGIYIVPVGELEGFVKCVGGHGPDWVNKVLEQYPDLNNQVYNEIRNFIAGMKL